MTKEKNTLQPMPHMTIAEMANASGGTYRGDPSLLDRAVTGVYIDSRQVTPGCLFVPIKGARVDGHTFIPQVMEAGALCTLSEVDWAQTDQQDTACGEYSEELISAMRSIPYILVESTEKALQDLAAWYRINLDIPVIGITGSYGKTSAKEMAAAILGEQFSVLKTAVFALVPERSIIHSSGLDHVKLFHDSGSTLLKSLSFIYSAIFINASFLCLQ